MLTRTRWRFAPPTRRASNRRVDAAWLAWGRTARERGRFAPASGAGHMHAVGHVRGEGGSRRCRLECRGRERMPFVCTIGERACAVPCGATFSAAVSSARMTSGRCAQAATARSAHVADGCGVGASGAQLAGLARITSGYVKVNACRRRACVDVHLNACSRAPSWGAAEWWPREPLRTSNARECGVQKSLTMLLVQFWALVAADRAGARPHANWFSLRSCERQCMRTLRIAHTRAPCPSRAQAAPSARAALERRSH